jgi:hypothetical protein
MKKIKDVVLEVADNKYKVVISAVAGVFAEKFELISKLVALIF